MQGVQLVSHHGETLKQMYAEAYTLLPILLLYRLCGEGVLIMAGGPLGGASGHTESGPEESHERGR